MSILLYNILFGFFYCLQRGKIIFVKNMSLKLKNEFIEADLQLGPMPDFHGSFERFFVEKAANLIFGSKSSSSASPTCSTSSYENDEEYIVRHLIKLKILF